MSATLHWFLGSRPPANVACSGVLFILVLISRALGTHSLLTTPLFWSELSQWSHAVSSMNLYTPLHTQSVQSPQGPFRPHPWSRCSPSNLCPCFLQFSFLIPIFTCSRTFILLFPLKKALGSPSRHVQGGWLFCEQVIMSRQIVAGCGRDPPSLCWTWAGCPSVI